MDSHTHFLNCKRDPCFCDLKRYWLVLCVAAVILALEVAGGIWAGSLALLSDAGHVLVDKLAILTAIYAEYTSVKRAGVENRVRRGGAYFKSALLFLAACWIAREAWERWGKGGEIISWAVIVIASIGAAGNYIQFRILHPNKGNLTSRAMRLHVLSDLWQSFGVVAGAVLIWLTGVKMIDLIVSVLIALYMFYYSIKFFISIIKSR